MQRPTSFTVCQLLWTVFSGIQVIGNIIFSLMYLLYFGRSRIQGIFCVIVKFCMRKTQVHKDDWIQPRFCETCFRTNPHRHSEGNNANQSSIEYFQIIFSDNTFYHCSESLMSCLQAILMLPANMLPIFLVDFSVSF